MGARTPDAYRIGAGQVTQEYPADAVPACLRKQPSLPTMSRAPESSPVEQVVTAEVAVVRHKASGAPRSANDSRPSKDAAAVTQHQVAAREAAPAQAAPVVESPAREYAHLDEAVVAFEGDQRPGVPVHHDWHRTTMRVVNPAGEQAAHKRGVSAPALPVPTQSEETSGVGGASRAQRATRRSGIGASRMDRRERPARHGQHYRGLLMFLLGFISALLVVAAVVGGLYVSRSTAASGFANAVDSCHARGLHARLASDETSLTLEAFSDSGDSLTTPIFQCVLGKLGTPAAVRERMYATRAIDGTQSEEWGTYKATWTYEPDQGLTVIVSSR
ncbi:MAG: hypothetical protein ACLR2J_10380 [Actinomyces sp.]